MTHGIDYDRLRARCLGNAALQADLLALFHEHAPAEAARLRAAVDAGDAVAARAAAHKLKSAAGTVAATALHGLLVDVENSPTLAGVVGVEEELRRCLTRTE